MPTYSYKCPKCGSTVDLTRSIKEHSEFKPFCVQTGCDGQQQMETLIAAPAVHFKGGGWTPKHYDK